MGSVVVVEATRNLRSGGRVVFYPSSSHSFLLQFGVEGASLERLFVGLHLISLDSEGFLHLVDSFDTALSVGVQLIGHAMCLLTLLKEAGVFGLLAHLSLVDHVLKDLGLFLQVSLNIVALGRGDLTNCLLLRV